MVAIYRNLMYEIVPKNQISINIDGSVQLCCATFDKAHVVAKSFLETSHSTLQSLRYSNAMCTPCMEKGQHVYFSYDVGKKLDQLGDKRLNETNSKFLFNWVILTSNR